MGKLAPLRLHRLLRLFRRVADVDADHFQLFRGVRFENVLLHVAEHSAIAC